MDLARENVVEALRDVTGLIWIRTVPMIASRRWDSGGSPAICCVPVVQWPRTPPFHGGNTGSNPVGDANFLQVLSNV